ncbi:hypothetical protein C9I57_10295 [Trinickia symbiotica]|uniref:UDP-N-acetylglucosamine 2-epimerase domain-containing protein n=1 Tax=Trinickia symbiotica TaxID=863227 RepID=A0A2T3XX83_9BURK|nr:hypothetical protein [Trinickia symbiotica]PTB21091.1 hypothetical protein C9I57_10295 [Trinickia symbiotica]
MRMLFFANDLGGGNALLPLIDKAGTSVNRCFLIAMGPSFDLWETSGLNPFKANPKTFRIQIHALIEKHRPDVIVTGTSIGSRFEHIVWSEAKRARVPTLAIIDGWVKIRDRFLGADRRRALPERFGAVDLHIKRTVVRTCKVSPSRIDVVGHPHLQAITADLRRERRTRAIKSCPTIGFFSTPLVDSESTHGIAAANDLVRQLAARPRIKLLIKPHPRERIEPWKEWIASLHADPIHPAMEVCISDSLPTKQILKEVDIAIGLPTSVMIEAAFAGIPVIILEPTERSHRNPAIDRYLSDRVARTCDELIRKMDALASIEETRIFDDAITREADSRAMRVVRILGKA